MDVDTPDPRVQSTSFLRAGRESSSGRGDLAVEEPLEIRIHEQPLTVTMRTPGDDRDLTTGLLFTEGIIRHAREIGTIRHCGSAEERNVVNVTLAAGVSFDLARLRHNFFGNSSCGLCGKAAIEQIRTQAPPLESDLRMPWKTIASLPPALRRSQTAFEKTGGLHAAGIFDPRGELLVAREDIGRHNAVDKAIGAMLLQDRIPLNRHVLLVSGRASFEILQKALMASIPVVCAVSAPSSLAVEFARECGMTLVGFLRGEEMNVYSEPQRIVLDKSV